MVGRLVVPVLLCFLYKLIQNFDLITLEFFPQVLCRLCLTGPLLVMLRLFIGGSLYSGGNSLG